MGSKIKLGSALRASMATKTPDQQTGYLVIAGVVSALLVAGGVLLVIKGFQEIGYSMITAVVTWWAR